jgi:hypothetical protein
MNPTVIHEIMKRLKTKKGCTIAEFGIIPESARFSDLMPRAYYPIDDIKMLMEWNLIEAYKGTRLVPLEKFDSQDVRALKFYLSPYAVKLEDIFGFDLAARPVFGKPQSSSWPDVLMLMPFAPQLRPVFDDHVKKVSSSLKLSAGRADDFFSKNSIMHDVWSAIFYAKIVIADCTKRNPNVFYEIGIGHTLGKDTILISQALKDIPFDLRHLRVIVYELTPRGMTEFEQELEWAIRSLLPSSRYFRE